MLYARRKRLEVLAEAEAAGESFWAEGFDKQARMKLIYAFLDACHSQTTQQFYAEVARNMILRDEGLPYLQQSGANPLADLLSCLRDGDDEFLPTVIEALTKVLVIPGRNFGVLHEYETADHEHFWNTVNTVLREHRISFELVGDAMVPFASKELHTEIVVPTMRLLSGRVGWEKVESAYQDALGEIADGKPADAITDAGTALQEAFVALRCEGNTLGALAKSARNKGLFAPHDVLMTDMLHKLVDWVSADRSEKGDVHQAREPSVEDAWLTVHIVGAVILRLVGPPRN